MYRYFFVVYDNSKSKKQIFFNGRRVRPKEKVFKFWKRSRSYPGYKKKFMIFSGPIFNVFLMIWDTLMGEINPELIKLSS